MRFVEPRSLEEANQRRDVVIEAIRAIQLDLGDRRRRQWLNGKYEAWRLQALRALKAKDAEARKLRRWIAKYNEAMHAPPVAHVSVDGTLAMLHRAHEALESVRGHLSAEYVAVVDRLYEFLNAAE